VRGAGDVFFNTKSTKVTKNTWRRFAPVIHLQSHTFARRAHGAPFVSFVLFVLKAMPEARPCRQAFETFDCVFPGSRPSPG
jgi:hypothetical protein